MTEIWGDYIEIYEGEMYDFLDIGFSANSRPIKQRWRTNRLSAFFVADYLTTFLPISDDDPNSNKKKDECKGAVSYVANELLENAMKFHNQETSQPIRFGLRFLEKPEISVLLFTTNTISQEAKTNLQNFITRLSSHDASELYLEQLELSAQDENITSSGLGLLTMVNDYNARLGWKFVPDTSTSDMIFVTTVVQILL